MTETKKAAAKATDGAKKRDPSALHIVGDEADRDKLLAQTVLRPSVQAASTLQKWSGITNDLNLMELIKELSNQSKLASGGDLARSEAMLVNQAHTLDAIFNNLARRSALNAGEYLEAAERYMRLALKAQSQCRATIETLAEIKNPKPVAFVQQANIANGPQQVNNSTPAPARAENRENQQSKLLEQTHAERLDFGTASAATGANLDLEALDAINGSQNK